MAKRAILFLIAVALIAAGVMAYILVRRGSPPTVVKLLPAADDYLYFNVAMVRRSTFFHGLPKVQFDPDYAEFVRQTGFDFESDLDEAAFALQRPESEAPPAQPAEWKNTGIFTASFDQSRLEAYLKGVAQEKETYRNTTIYAVPLPGRTVRIAILSARTVAISNTDGPYVLQGIIDRAAQFGGGAPALVHDYFGKVPWGSVAWAIARPAAGSGGNERLELPGGFALFLPAETVLVASVRYLGSIDLRAQAFAPTPEGAEHVAEQLSAFLSVFHVLENSQANGRDKDVKTFFDSIQVTHEANRAQLQATIPADFLKKLAADASAADTKPVPAAPKQPQTQSPTQPAPKPSPRKPSHPKSRSAVR